MAATCSRRCFSTWATCGRSCTSGPRVWLSNLGAGPRGRRLAAGARAGQRDLARGAAKWLTIAIEAVVENYREYRDYNTTTTHSDHGELLYTLVDFLRLRAEYDRVAWNLKPVVMAHEILVRQNRPAAAEMWQQALAERTAEAADANLARFEKLCDEYGIRLASVAERLGERFTRPLAIDRVRALVGPAMDAAGSGDRTAVRRAGSRKSKACSREPAGAGLDLPDWLAALEEEVSMVRCAKRHRETGDDDALRRIEQVRLAWDELQQQLANDGELGKLVLDFAGRISGTRACPTAARSAILTFVQHSEPGRPSVSQRRSTHRKGDPHVRPLRVPPTRRTSTVDTTTASCPIRWSSSSWSATAT